MEGYRLESGKSRLERENENGGSLVTKGLSTMLFWVGEYGTRSKDLTGREGDRWEDLRSLSDWDLSWSGYSVCCRFKQVKNIFTFTFSDKFCCEFAHFLTTLYQLSEHQVFCDQSDGGGEDGVPWSRLLRPSRQLRREHHPPRPLQGDQGLLSLNKFLILQKAR